MSPYRYVKRLHIGHSITGMRMLFLFKNKCMLRPKIEFEVKMFLHSFNISPVKYIACVNEFALLFKVVSNTDSDLFGSLCQLRVFILKIQTGSSKCVQPRQSSRRHLTACSDRSCVAQAGGPWMGRTHLQRIPHRGG